MEKDLIHPAPAPRRGFTLVELLLAVAISVVVAAIAVPRFSNATTRYRLDAAARRVATDLEYTQHEAIASSSSRTVTFDCTAKCYTITRLDSGGNPVTVATVKLHEPPYQITAMAVDAVATKFDGYGKPDAANSIVLRVGNDQKTITLDVLTGKARVN